MRKYHKAQCAELIRILEEAHGEIMKHISKGDAETAADLLEQCQQGAITIGEMVEASEGEGTEAVSRLESYCELTYRIHEDLMAGNRVNPAKMEKQLRKIIRSVQNSINALPTQFEAVFLPYKASMWDSLESIWMAADADENCDAYVIPIPYYDRNPDGSFASLHYETDQYPDYVPVTKYNEYDFQKHHPDMIFIHNPYDNINLVTAVHPDFYSDKLKEYTDCLVYVPYFATAGKMGEGAKSLPSYSNMDYIVVQSREIIDQYDRQLPREKFLPLGSPKFDRVIRMCQNPPDSPEGWAEQMEGRRVYFYNTSIAGLLEDTGKFLQKMAYVFNTFKGVEDACLLWRPHPLLESTLDSMRPEYRTAYDAIKQEYIEEGIGIFDITSDIEAAISHSHAYIGDAGTSVISLFEAAGKPVFFLDKKAYGQPEKNAWKRNYRIYPSKDKRFTKAVRMPKDKIFWSPDNDLHYKFFCNLPKDPYEWGYVMAFSFGGHIYVFPRNAQDILDISEATREIRRIPLKKRVKGPNAFERAMVFGEKYAFLIPNQYPDVVRFSFETGRLDYIGGIRDRIWEQDAGKRRICGCMLSGRRRLALFCVDHGASMLSLDVDTLDMNEVAVGFGNSIRAFLPEGGVSEQYYWFFPYAGTRVIRWNREDNTFQKYDLKVDGLYSYDAQKGQMCDENYFSSFTVLGDKVIFAPQWGNKFVKLELGSGEAEEWIPPFSLLLDDVNPYVPNRARGFFMWDAPGHAWGYANAPERNTYAIDFNSNTAKSVEIIFDHEEIIEHYARGFKDGDAKTPVCCYESEWNDLRSIAEGRIKGQPFSREAQEKAFSRISADTDGKCGATIYTTLKNRLRYE